MLKFFCTVILKLGQSKTSNLPSWCNCKKYNLSFFGSRGEIVRKNDNVSILKMHNITYQVYGEKFWATWFTKGFRKNHSSGFSWVLPFLTPKVACLHHIWWAKSGRLAFQYLIFMIWRPCDLNLVMISSLASKCQDLEAFNFIS